MRTCSVFSPRRTRNESSGPGTAPTAFCRKASFSCRSSRRSTSAPATTSLWPFRYLVIECATMSNPSSSGRWKNGVAKVLSQTEITERLRQFCASAARSQIFSIGLVGVSTQSSFVFGRNAPSTARASATST